MVFDKPKHSKGVQTVEGASPPVQAARFSVKNTVTLVATLLFLLSLIVVSAVQLHYVKTEMEVVLAEHQYAFVARVADEFDQKLVVHRDFIVAGTKTIPPEIFEDADGLQKWAAQRQGLRSIFSDVIVISAKGIVMADTPARGRQGLDLSDREYVRTTVETRQPHISKPFIGRTVKEPVVTFSAPVLDKQGAVVLVLSGTLNLLQPNFLGNMAEARVGKTGSFAIFTHDRTIVISRDKSRILTQGPPPGESPYFDRATAGREGSEESVNSRGLRAIFSYTQLKTVPWALVASLPVEEAYAPIQATQRRIVEVTLLLGFLIAPLVWLGVRRYYDPMERRVRERTAALKSSDNRLRGEITERRQAEQRIRTQLQHLSLLDQITRSTGERLDLKSIFQIVLIRLEENLPIEFGCVCLYDAAANTLRVTSVGAKSEALARELTLDEHATIDIDANGLARCIQGHLVYEPDIGQVRFAFPQRLARGGLGSLVLAPLKSESRVFGMLIVARRAAQAFSSAESEFLRQLSEHVALAAHQAQLYSSLQQAYDDLRQTQAVVMQEERLRALGQMASGIAHDINNALSPVSLYVESLLETERALSERARGYLQTIQRAVEDVAQTVARMREFYRKREQQLELTPVQLNAMVQQVLDLTRARWYDMPQQRGVVIRALTELAPDLPQVMGVESEIREALTNLVFNAVDAMPEGGTLTLRTRLLDADGQHPAVAVEVTDTGSGMDEDTRKRCLEPFFTTKGERGTGLGLAMVFGMVQRHSAGIEIDSVPGAGTTVRFVFAVSAAVHTESGQPVVASEVPSGLRLLLIDDDPVLIESLQDTLQTDGHVIIAANGGEAGIAAFRASLESGEPFAAVITDLGMPHIDGHRVAAAVKDASRETPVILLTGWGQRLVADNDISPHVDRVLAKPPKLRELREVLAQLCAGSQRTEKTA